MTAIEDTRQWLERAVIGLNLCPFAKAVHMKEQIRWVESPARDPEQLRDELVRELYASFSDFAAAQVAWLDRLANVHAFDGLHEGARVMRISARQVGVFDAAEACERLQAAALAHNAADVAQALEDLHDVLAAARPWVDALAAG